MFGVSTETALGIAVLLCLGLIVVHAFILNRRITELRRSRDELARIVSSFNEASIRAEAKIPKMKKATIEANNTLQDRVEKAHIIRDDLAFMNERAEALVERLEKATQSTTKASVSAVAAKSMASSRAVLPSGVEPSVAAQTLAGVAAATSDETAPNPSDTEDHIETDFSKESLPANLWPTGAHATVSKATNEERSEAERALLKALESAR